MLLLRIYLYRVFIVKYEWFCLKHFLPVTIRHSGLMYNAVFKTDLWPKNFQNFGRVKFRASF